MDSRSWVQFASREPEEGDYTDGYLLVWHILQGAFARKRTGRPLSKLYSHWRTMPTEGWIAAAEKKPTAQDADHMGCVLARSDTDGYKVTGWHQFAHDPRFTQWMPTPEEPEDAVELRKKFWME